MELADISRANSLVALFLARADERGDAPFLTAKIDGIWTLLTWREAARQVIALAASLRAMDLMPGERVVIVSENRPEWVIADLAIMAAGCITTPAYITNTPADHRHILADSGAGAVIVSNAKLARPLLEAMRDAGEVCHVIAIEEIGEEIEVASGEGVTLHRWQDAVRCADEAATRAAVEAQLATTTRDTIACIIYTSGTSAAPKGVMLHHGAILANVEAAGAALAHDFGWGTERFLSFLPLSHAFEHTAGLMLPIGLGAEIWYAEGLEKLASNLTEASPSFMVVVPRLFELLRTRIIKQVEKQGAFARLLLRLAMRNGAAQLDGEAGPTDRAVNWLLERTLRPKIRQRFGGQMRAMVSGGAPLNPEVGAFFSGLGVELLQGYGQTEAAPVIACNVPSAGIRLRTVGPPLGDAEVRTGEDGEILVRGELVMKGYWNNAEETRRVLRDGWLHTGDIGHFDEAGRIVITDRKKDLIVNDKGENIAPQKLEGMLTLQPEIAQAMVSGDRRPYVVALIVPDADWASGWAREHGVDMAGASAAGAPAPQSNEAFLAAIRAAIERTNTGLSNTEKIRRFIFADEPFAPANGELTATLKLRRTPLRTRYGERLNALY